MIGTVQYKESWGDGLDGKESYVGLDSVVWKD